MATYAPVRSAFQPAIPQTFPTLGVPEALMLDLVLRRMLLEGQCTLAGLSRSLRVSVPIIDAVFRHMRAQQLWQRLPFRALDGREAACGRTLSSLSVRRRLPGLTERLSFRHQAAVRQGACGPQDAAQRIFRSGGGRSYARSTRARDYFAEFDFCVRAYRKRKNQPGGAHAARLSGRGANPLCGGGRQPDHQRV